MAPVEHITIFLLGFHSAITNAFPFHHNSEQNSINTIGSRATRPNAFNVTVLPPTPPTCLGPEFDLLPPVQADCGKAREKMEGVTWYKRVYNYGKMYNADIRLPIKFVHESCNIVLDCPDGLGDRFSLQEIASAVKMIRRVCIRDKPPGMRFGGLAGVGNGHGFFMVVQGNPRLNATKGVTSNDTGSRNGGLLSPFGKNTGLVAGKTSSNTADRETF